MLLGAKDNHIPRASDARRTMQKWGQTTPAWKLLALITEVLCCNNTASHYLRRTPTPGFSTVQGVSETRSSVSPFEPVFRDVASEAIILGKMGIEI